MYIDLTDTSVTNKITLNGVVDGNTLSITDNSKTEKTFVFKNSKSDTNDIEIGKTEEVKSSGSVISNNNVCPKAKNFISIDDSSGIFFSTIKYGVFGGMCITSNIGSGDSFSLTMDDETYKFQFGSGSATDTIYINVGASLYESVSYTADAINNTIQSWGMFAYTFGNKIVLTQNTILKNANYQASAVITFNSKAISGDYVTMLGTTFTFGTSSGKVPIGDNANDSANYMAKAINESNLASSVAIENKIYLYNKADGSAGNSSIECPSSASPRFISTDFTGGNDSDLSISLDAGSMKIIAIRNVIVDGTTGKSFACLSSALACADSELTTFNEFSSSSNSVSITNATYKTKTMTAYGGNIIVTGISEGSQSKSDDAITAENLKSTLSSLYTDAVFSIEDNCVTMTMNNYLKSQTSAQTISCVIPEGTLASPISWEAMLVYYEINDILSLIENGGNFNLTLVKGSFIGKTPLSIEEASFNGGSISLSTLYSPIIYGSNTPITMSSQCDRPKIYISGIFINNSSLSTGSLVLIQDSYDADVEIINCENTINSYSTPLVRVENCLLNSIVYIGNSTFTVSDLRKNASYGIKVTGNVSVTSRYNVFEGASSSNDTAYFIGNNCSLNSSNDVFSNINPSNNSNATTYLDCKKISETVVIDRNRNYWYSLNLKPNSKALCIGTDSCVNDIFGNVRSLNTKYGVQRIIINDSVIGNYIFTSDNYITINNVKKNFGVELKSTYSTQIEMAYDICNVFSGNADFKIIPINETEIGIDIYGTYGMFSTNISSTKLTSKDFVYVTSGVDAGSRQKTTSLDKTYYVDLSISDVVDADGEKTNPFSLSQMISWIKSSYPCYGSMKFIVSNSNDTFNTFDLSKDIDGNYASGYCNIQLVGQKLGKLKTSTIKSSITTGGSGLLSFVFDSLIVNGNISGDNEENNVNEIRFINSLIVGNINSYNSVLRLVESSINGSINTNSYFIMVGCAMCNGSAASTQENGYIKYRYNYIVGNSIGLTNKSTTTIDTEGSTYGSNCFSSASPKTLSDFELVDSAAVSLSPRLNFLEDPYASNYDVVGNLRSSDSSKVSIDCGGYELKTVAPAAVTLLVNLSSSVTENGGTYTPCSLSEAYEKIYAMDTIDRQINIEISGYGSNLPTLILNKEFTDSGYINFIAEPNSVMDSFVDGVGFELSSENARVSFSSLIIRNDKTTFTTSGLNSSLIFCSCVLLNSSNSLAFISGSDWTSKFYGITYETSGGILSDLSSIVVGCLSYGGEASLINNATYSSANAYEGGELPNGTSYTGLISNCLNKEYLKNDDFKILNTSAIGLVVKTNFGVYLEEAESFNYMEDIRGFSRFDSSETTDFGCYDSMAANDATSFEGKPNGQFAQITKEGSSFLTRMLTGNFGFKIVGYAIGRGGYSKKNPINSIPITGDGICATYKIIINDNDLTSEDGISIGSRTFICGTDFELGSSIEHTIANIVSSINENSGVAFAENGTSYIRITIATSGELGNGIVSSLSDSISVEQTIEGTDSIYGIDIALPSDGYREFQYVEYLPLAISLFLRVERDETQMATGEIIVYAEATKTENTNELNTLIPFAVVRHGLVTKDKDTILVKRIIIQI